MKLLKPLQQHSFARQLGQPLSKAATLAIAGGKKRSRPLFTFNALHDFNGNTLFV